MSSNESLSPEHSLAQNGKSFHWAGRLLGAQTGRDAARLYSICRVLDDMADLHHLRLRCADPRLFVDMVVP